MFKVAVFGFKEHFYYTQNGVNGAFLVQDHFWFFSKSVHYVKMNALDS